MSQNIFKPIGESMTAEQIADHQSEHYAMDDRIRRGMGKMTLEQKQKIHDFMAKLMTQEES